MDFPARACQDTPEKLVRRISMSAVYLPVRMEAPVLMESTPTPVSAPAGKVP